jgi:hypothetical protein
MFIYKKCKTFVYLSAKSLHLFICLTSLYIFYLSTKSLHFFICLPSLYIFLSVHLVSTSVYLSDKSLHLFDCPPNLYNCVRQVSTFFICPPNLYSTFVYLFAKSLHFLSVLQVSTLVYLSAKSLHYIYLSFRRVSIQYLFICPPSLYSKFVYLSAK